MRLYDTARQATIAFEPPPLVRIYTCGVTPYDTTHIGHAACFVSYDVLQRRLRDLGHETRCVRNVTDVDDSILAKARSLGVHYLDLAAGEVAKFDKDMEVLNQLPSYSEPRATSAIPDILGFIEKVIDAGHAYATDGGVFFDVASWPGFGQISHLDRATMLAYAAERGGNVDDPYKRDPLDFILWQPSLEDEPAWESRWGAGRPGWHIECSALSMRELDTPTLDLHGGGADLIFPHHECEAAQSEAVTGKPFCRHWMHYSYVKLGGIKMSKSLGNLVYVHRLVEDGWDPLVIRLIVVSHHYRSGWEWFDHLLEDNRRRLETWQSAGAGDGALEEVRAALDDDLDTPAAVAAIDRAAARGVGVSEAAALLGIEWGSR
jgi:L-cysteine:1D-myo-inositol 2-amino-2-deoxy-alpha-D-glucopyranoside ligase